MNHPESVIAACIANALCVARCDAHYPATVGAAESCCQQGSPDEWCDMCRAYYFAEALSNGDAARADVLDPALRLVYPKTA